MPIEGPGTELINPRVHSNPSISKVAYQYVIKQFILIIQPAEDLTIQKKMYSRTPCHHTTKASEFQNVQDKNWMFQFNTLFSNWKNNFSKSECFKGIEWKRYQLTDYDFLIHYTWCAWLSESKIYKTTEISNHLSTW